VGYGAGGYPIVRKGWKTVQQVAAELRALCRGCVKTLTKIFGQKIDRLERSTSDDRHLGNGFGTPNFSASLDNFEFLHRLQRKRNFNDVC
jgi:cell fate regulator YaaT (PSP1 superfamily)